MSLLQAFITSFCETNRLPTPEFEFKFHDARKWRFDFAWVKQKLAMEIDGAIWIQGRHTRGAGVEKDCEKLSEAAILGWRILRASTGQVESGVALGWIERALQKEKASVRNSKKL